MRSVVLFLALLLPPASTVRAAAFLFDASKHEMAGNADWVVDADTWDLNLPAYPCSGTTNESRPGRFPTPAQSGIGPGTPETYWTGGISSWAVDLVKAGHTVETLPPGGSLTYGDAGNPQDLSHYQVLVAVEPQNPFTAAEKAAILAFVTGGGGLFMVADHETSDRDCDGWDAPHVFNDLTGATSASSAGAFGIWFRVNGLEDQGGEDWFNDGVDANVETDPADPIISGPFGSGSGGLGLFGSTSMDLNLTDNPAARAHVWRTGQAHGLLRATFVTAAYGAGRVAAIGDSSPADDDTGDAGDSLFPGWDKAAGGVKNREIHLNACAWLLNPAPDTQPPAIVAGPSAAATDCAATVTWSTDEAATSRVDYGATASYGAQATAPGLSQDHAVALAPLTPATEIHYQALSFDAVGNGPATSTDATFVTAAAAPPLLLAGPQATGITGTGVTITWTTDEPATSIVEYGLTESYGSSLTGLAGVTSHAVTLGGLAPTTAYHYRVLSADACGQGPTASSDGTFTTGAAAIDLSGWKLQQANSAQTWTFPAGTLLPSGGVLVVGRNATRAEFEGTYPSMPAATVYLNSNASGSCSTAGCIPQINGGESFSLVDAAALLVDGPTIAMATTHAAYQRNHPGDPAGQPSSWTIVSESLATPGQGPPGGSGAGVRITEMSDASEFTREFVELVNDASGGPPDTTAPGRVTDLVATPVSADTIRLSWTAVGDDGTSGAAAAYDVRRSPARILTEADFAAATLLTGEPAPQAAGAAEQMTVTGLAPDTPVYFALKVADEVPNLSVLSNGAAGVTAPTGGGPAVPHLVIAQIRIAGSTDDAIELYNPTSSPIALTNMSVQYLAANGNFGFRVNLTAANSVPAHGWYLVAANGHAGSPPRDDSMGTSNLSSTAGHALLVSKTTNVSGCSDVAILDRVGYGATAVCPEGSAATTPGAGTSISRKPGGQAGAGQDTDQNAQDFLAPAAPLFHNRASTPAVPPGGLGNVHATLYLAKEAGGTRLEWANAAGATAYRVYRGISPGFMSGSPSPWATPATATALDPADPGTLFFYLVRATDGVSESED